MKNNIYSIITLVAIAVNIIFIITAVFFERKKPVQALSWVLALSLLPGFGFFLYLLFGRKSFKQYSHIVFENYVNIPYGKTVGAALSNDSIRQLLRLNAATSRSAYTDDNKVQIFTNAREKYDALIKDIEAAKHSIHMLYFIIQNDHIGKKIKGLLAEKAKQGVEVRLLFDHGSNLLMPFKAYKAITDNGGEVFTYFSNTIDNYLKVNFRNHRKIVVIDGKIGYTGGINIGDEYMGLVEKTSPWRDTHVRMTGHCVMDLQLSFIEDWIYASKTSAKAFDTKKYFPEPGPEQLGNTGIQIVTSGPDTGGEEIKRGFIKMINSARKNIFIQTPYFIPDTSVLEALQNAAFSGVNVILQIPAKPDKRYVYKATMSYVADVLDYGIKVYLYPGFLHAKMLVVDDNFCSIGTANVDMRSFALNFELNAFMYGSEITGRCTEIFNNDLKGCTQLTKEKFNSRSIFSRMEEGIYRLMSPIL